MKHHFSQSTYTPFHEKASSTETSKKHPEDFLLDALQKTRYDLENAYTGFNNTCDPELIDCYIYEMTALTKRYDYLLHQVSLINLTKNLPFVSDTEPSVSTVPNHVLA